MATDVDTSRVESGFYCSTSGTFFSDKDSLAEHYKSDFHKYNLKRKVAGLPPVTRDWFDARKAQLVSTSVAAAAAPAVRVWVDPLTKKKFMTENTYTSFVSSKKYQELVRKSGAPAPAPVIVTKKESQDDGKAAAVAPPTPPQTMQRPAAPGYQVVGRLATQQVRGPQDTPAAQEGAEEEGEEEQGSDSGWETASTDTELQAGNAAAGGVDGEEWQEWDVCLSLFDGHVSPSFQANLEYMLKKYGFYLPDAQYLADPEGLLKYLGNKLRYGRVPLYVSGEDPNPKQFRSLHAVQRHMVDTNQCKVLYDDNEDEYEEFYDYDLGKPDDGEQNEDDDALQLAALSGISGGPTGGIAGYELVVGSDASGAGAKILGTRELARYYRQRHKPQDERQCVVVNTMLARYRALGAPLSTDDTRDVVTKKEATRQARRGEASRMKMGLITSVLKKLPKNCPY